MLSNPKVPFIKRPSNLALSHPGFSSKIPLFLSNYNKIDHVVKLRIKSKCCGKRRQKRAAVLGPCCAEVGLFELIEFIEFIEFDKLRGLLHALNISRRRWVLRSMRDSYLPHSSRLTTV